MFGFNKNKITIKFDETDLLYLIKGFLCINKHSKTWVYQSMFYKLIFKFSGVNMQRLQKSIYDWLDPRVNYKS